MRENLATLLEAVGDALGDRPAIMWGTVTRGWRELDERAARLARQLADAGIGRGDRIAIALYNGPEYVESVFAAMKLRCAAVNVNYRYREWELLRVLGDSGAAALVVDAALTSVAAAAAARLPRLRTIVRLGRSEPPGPGGPDPLAGRADDYERVVKEGSPLPRIERSGDDEWLIFTGGTTGRPKGVVSRHANLTSVALGSAYAVRGLRPPADVPELAAAVRRMAAERRTVMLVAPPLTHGTGLYATLGALLAAGTVVFLTARSYDADELAGLIERHSVTELCLVGDVFARPLADALDRAAAAGRPYDLSSLRRAVSAGAIWSAEVKQRLLSHFDARLEDVVGASEGSAFARSVTTRGRVSVTSRFELVPGVRVIDEDGADVVPGSGRIGVLAAPASPHIHYLNDPGGSAVTFRDIDGQRYCVPGDMATVETDGSLMLFGRGSRVINTGGEKVFAEEVEQVIARHPGIEDVYVIGVPDERWGERIAAVVALRPGAALTAEDIRALVGAELAHFKKPRDIALLRRLRRSPAGKADLAWARDVINGTAPPPEA
jgi:acyl-CoA synthetase (AMP-forming)/AMP-acid ligase II